MRPLPPAVVAALAAVALGCAGVASAARPVLALDEGISAIAADGTRVAVAVRGTRATCDGILVWTPSSGRTVRVNSSANCPGGQGAREGIREVALAGRRLGWIEEASGNLQHLTLRVHRLDKQKTLDLAFAENHDGAEGFPDGSYVGNLRGDGNVLAYNTWSVCTLVPADYEWDAPSCAGHAGSQPTAVTGGERLWTLAARRLLFGAGPSALALTAIDRGRAVTVNRRDVTVFGPDGAEIGGVRLGAGRLEGVGLWGGLVIVMRASRLEVYSASTGEFVRTLPVPAGSRLVDVDGDLAALVATSSITVVRLTDGVSKTFRIDGGRAVGADLEPSGLYHAWSLEPGARIVFVPRAELG